MLSSTNWELRLVGNLLKLSFDDKNCFVYCLLFTVYCLRFALYGLLLLLTFIVYSHFLLLLLLLLFPVIVNVAVTFTVNC